MTAMNPANHAKLTTSQNIWLASVRPDGRPHLVPIWFTWHSDNLYICTEAKSIKSRNIAHNPRVMAALEDGTSPVICEGIAAILPPPWPDDVIASFVTKYEWEISPDDQYNQLIEITPSRWLNW